MALTLQFRTLAVSLIICFISFHAVFASSQSPRPLKRIARPMTLSLEILPRQFYSPSQLSTDRRRSSHSPQSTTLRHTDSFRLVLRAFGTDFYLHLRPNEHLIHPAARINYFHTDPISGVTSLTRTEPLLRESVKAYWGEVVPPHLSDPRLREDASHFRRPGTELGWARIFVHHQGDMERGIPPVFEGAFSAYGVIHHITTQDNYFRNRHDLDPHLVQPLDDDDPESPLYVWRDSDVMSADEETASITGFATSTNSRTCGYDNLPFNTDPSQNHILQKPFENLTVLPWYDPFGFTLLNESVVKRQDIAGNTGTYNFAGSIGSGAGCPTSQKVLYMGVAADCAYTGQYGSQQNATLQILNDWNTASALYMSTFNVSLGIIELQIQNSTCPSQTDPDIPWNVGCTPANITLIDRLSLFSQWRGLKGNDGAGLWHLMSGCPTGTEVGIAWLGTLCQTTSTGTPGNFVGGTAVSTPGRTEWQVVAHETGHNFGAIHDCTSGCNSSTPCCPLNSTTCDANSQFIMSPIAEPNEMQFSACSLGNICSLMLNATTGSTNTTCLLDPAQATKQVLTVNMCGNGVVEAGEECDPGPGVTSPCCDSATCQFAAGALCDPMSSDCCTASCAFALSTQVCRPAVDPTCDVAEMCTGNTSACPQNVVAPNGRSCGAGGLACASGQCTSVSQQCQTVGASMNLQQACPAKNDQSCQLSCVDPTQPSECVTLQSLLTDGSPCGYGGTCMQGSCKSGTLLDTIKSWYVQNLQISIPATVGAVILLPSVIWLLYIGCRRCRRNKRHNASSEPTLSKKQAARLSSWGPGPFPDDMAKPQPVVIQPPLATMPQPVFPPQAQPYLSPGSNIPDALRPGARPPLRSFPSRSGYSHQFSSSSDSDLSSSNSVTSLLPRKESPLVKGGSSNAARPERAAGGDWF